ncbi:MAG: GTP-binding protein [Candidatus Portnoybacteria bacterium]|nr:GTP-binding protein [Candidatus Portnoybacteria bacterium]
MKKIRNFVIISHIDHGKSTLADRFLEITNTVDKRKMQPQYLDRMGLEREKGITIKMQPVRMEWKNCILNLIDTPGHVDFSYEVSRSLAAVEGAVLLVDATQGVQAQTLTNLDFAKKQGLKIIPVINKIDLVTAEIDNVKEEIVDLLDVKKEDIICVSAKTGENVDKVLDKIIESVPGPKRGEDGPLRALIFDSEYDSFKGVVAYIRIFSGSLNKGDKIFLMQSKTRGEAIEVGYFKPELISCAKLDSGEMGYVATGLKNIENCRVGDTLALTGDVSGVSVLKGYREPQPTIFASFYPIDKDDYDSLKQALEKLKLNDASLNFSPESSGSLGRGFRCGFLGMLHLEIITERLKRDYDLDLVVTSPSVVYIEEGGKKKEPFIELEIITPERYFGEINKLLESFAGEFEDTKWIKGNKVIIKYKGPLDIILKGIYDKLKTVSSGYASMGYKFLGHREADLVNLDILINKEKVDAFSKVVRKEDAYREGRKIVSLLKENLPSHQWAIPIQAAVNGKIVARETRKAMRKDVTAPLYGGDFTRKRKLLEKQKKGKKKLAQFGQVNIPSDVFLKVLKEK